MRESLRKMRAGQFATIVALFLLAIMGGIEVRTAWLESPTIDEAVHLSSGYSYWLTGDFRMNPEHPPLMKLLSAVPLLFTSAELPLDHPSWAGWNQWEFGDQFLFQNQVPVTTLLLLGRLPTIALSLVLGWWIFSVSRSLFGPWAGVFSLTLYATDPNIIAHSRFITTDLGFTALAFASIHRLVLLLQRPNRNNAIFFGFALFGAGMMKFSGIAWVVIILLLISLVKLIWPFSSALRWRIVWRWIAWFLPLSVMVLWGLYGFDIRRPADDPRIHQLYQQREELLRVTDPASLPPLERFAVERLGDRTVTIGSWLERAAQYPIPAYGFLRGFFAVIGHSIGGQEAYLFGQYQSHGWWYYFPVAFLVKTPLPTLVAVLAIVLIGLARLRLMKRRFGSWLNALQRTSLPVFIFAFVPVAFLAISTSSNLNLGWRHIMPIYPFLFVLAGFLTRVPAPRRFVGLRPALLLGLAAVLIQIGTYPNELGYFNATIGGHHRGPRILLDSNLDWGQDLPKLQREVERRDIQRLPFAFYGRADVQAYVPAAVSLPTSDDVRRHGRPVGLVAISVGQLYRQDRLFDWLWSEIPQTIVGSSIYLYQL